MTASELLQELEKLMVDASQYAGRLAELVPEEEYDWGRAPEYYWAKVPTELQEQAPVLERHLLTLAKGAVSVCKASLLVDGADLRDLQIAVKTVRSALYLRQYRYQDVTAIHDEGTVLGVQPASQDEIRLSPSDLPEVVRKELSTMRRVLELVDDQRTPLEMSGGSIGAGYRRDTAFIMMWMDVTEPELEDVRDTLREVFEAFGIKAVRADDVEHEGIITDRIIEEIKTSEFLLADLTGARPSVYYEVGYAHAIGKRVILFRKEGTPIHFDLAGYNCPEYRNLRDLRERLTRRLEQITNRKPRS